MLRETGFIVGGALLAATGVAFFGLLLLLGAGWWEFMAYLGSILMIGFGVFFIYVGRSEGADRRRTLEEMENDPRPPPP